MIAQDKLMQISQRHAFLEAKLNSGVSGEELTRLSKEYAELTEVNANIQKYFRALGEIESTKSLLNDEAIARMAADELMVLERAMTEIEHSVLLSLLPKEKNDDRPAVLEIRAGTGGEEAALFVADLFRMYSRYAEAKGWKLQTLTESATGIGGYREIIATVDGKDVFQFLKFESGVHRVQRVPATEASGRVHTSAATVAVLPQADVVDIDIPPGDIRIDTMRASGAGGQHVNTTDSAVRITHLPTGIVVTSSEKSQHQNRAQAMQVLRTRLYDMEQQIADAQRAATRKSQVGSGDRSERIRTYNFSQGRVTDHRINLTLYRLDAVMQGDLHEIIDALRASDEAERLAELSL